MSEESLRPKYPGAISAPHPGSRHRLTEGRGLAAGSADPAFCDAGATLLRQDDLSQVADHNQLAASGFSYASASRATGWLNRMLKNFGFTEARRSTSMIR